LTPSEVVRVVLERGLAVIALTDHDTLSGVAEAQAAAAGTALEVVSGVEVSAEGGQGSFHILGFYVSAESSSLNEKLQAMRDARAGRAREMVERLRELGMSLEWEEVRALAGGESVGRPHVARALLNRGYVETLQEAFDRFVGHGGLAYIPRLRLTPLEAIQAITEAGGIPVFAHPAYSGPAAMGRIPEFVGYGLRGLEVHYPHHSPEEVETLLELCQEHGLLATGGSDFHGPGSEEGAPLGSVRVPLACAKRLREAVTGGVGRASAPRA
jgi:predicted metal-dependent phosphoesterase TrpH